MSKALPGKSGTLLLPFWFWVLAVLGLGCALRLIGLGEWSLYGDEWFTFAHASDIGNHSFESVMPAIRAYPLIYLLTYLALQCFEPNETVLRLFPCVFGLLTLPVFFWLARRWLGQGGALMGTLFIAISPWLIFHSQLARFYTGALFFGMLAIFLFFQGLVQNRAGSMWWGILVFSTAMLFHPSSVVIVVGVMVFLLCGCVLSRSLPMPSPRCLLPLLLLALIGGTLMLLNFQTLRDTVLVNLTRQHSWAYSVPHLLLGIIYNFGFHLSLLAVYGLYTLWINHRLLFLYLLVMTVCALIPLLLLALLGKSVGQRYMIPVLPVLFLLAGRGGQVLLRDLVRKSRPAFLTVLGALLLLGLPSLYSHYQDGNRLDFRAAARYVSREMGAGDQILSQTHAIFSYYLDKEDGEKKVDNELRKPVIETSPELDGVPLRGLIRDANRVWVVVEKARLEADGFYSNNLVGFIKNRCVLEKTISRQRLDYHQNVLNIYRSRARGD